MWKNRKTGHFFKKHKTKGEQENTKRNASSQKSQISKKESKQNSSQKKQKWNT